MEIALRPYDRADYRRVLDICIAAFEPIHRGFEEAMGHRLFALYYHDWKERYARMLGRVAQEDAIAGDTDTRVYVAQADGVLAGFVFTIVDRRRRTGELGLNAVDPPFQGRGIGKAMYAFALEDLKRRGARSAYVGTGGDDAHEPARRAYAAMGFDRALPGLHLFKLL